MPSRLAKFNFVIGMSALSFQLGVLYPWHTKLDDDFKKLEAEQMNQLASFHQIKVSRLESIEKKLDDLALHSKK